MNPMTTIGERLRNYRKNKGLTQLQLAQMSKVTVNYISRFESDEFKNPTQETINRFARALEISPVELQYGFADERPRGPSPFGNLHPTKLDMFAVPLLTGTISAGSFSQDFTRWEGKTVQIPEKVRESWVAMQIRGKSMEPHYRDGDLVIVDTTVQFLDSDDVVVTRNGDEITVKQLKKLRDGTIELRPHNPDYPTITLKKDDDIKVMGVVVRLYRDPRRNKKRP